MDICALPNLVRCYFVSHYSNQIKNIASRSYFRLIGSQYLENYKHLIDDINDLLANKFYNDVGGPHLSTLIARFMGPTWGPSWVYRIQVGPMLAPWTSLSGNIWECLSFEDARSNKHICNNRFLSYCEEHLRPMGSAPIYEFTIVNCLMLCTLILKFSSCKWRSTPLKYVGYDFVNIKTVYE